MYSQLNTRYWLNLGRDKLAANDNVAAIDYFNTVIRFLPDMDEAYFLRSIAKYRLSDYRGALSDMTQAIKYNPYYSNYYMYRGDTKQKLYDLNGALKDYEKAIDLFPLNIDAYLCRGINYIYQKKYNDALTNFDKAVELDNKNANAYLYRAIGKQYNELRTQAITDFNKAITLAPDNADAYIKRGRNYFELKNYLLAIDDYNKALKIDFKNSYAYFNRGIALYELQDLNGALNDFNKVLELDSENALTYFIRASIKIELNDLYGAINDYTKVIDINSNNIFTYFNRAILWHKLKNYHKAIADYTKAIDLNPYFAGAYYNRAIARKLIKDNKGATADYNKANKIKTEHTNLDFKGKIDSTGLAKLIDLRADFEEGNVSNISNNNIGIMRFSNLQLSFNFGNIPSNIIIKLNEINLINNNAKGVGYFTISHDIEIPDSVNNKADSLHYLNTDSNFVLLVQSVIYQKTKSYNDALVKANLFLENNNTSALAYFNRANITSDYQQMVASVNELNSNIFYIGNNPQRQNVKLKPDEIIADYNKCIQLASQFYPAYFNLANTFINSKDFNAAAQSLNKVLEFDPKNGAAWFNKGLVNIYLQQTDEGCNDLSRAGELGVSSAYVVIKKYCGK